MTEFKYYLSGSPPYFYSTGSYMINEFQQNLNALFSVAPDFFTIQEESPFASGSYINTDVRVNHVIDTATGQNRGDDWKKLIFRDLSHSAPLGTIYYFDANYFITINTEIIKNLAASATVRRANATLRWIGKDGISYSEPCVIEYKISRPRDSMGSENPVLPEGYIELHAQLNSRTKLINSNQRFLFGPSENRRAYKVFAGGINNLFNQQTSDDNSGTLLTLSLGTHYINEDQDDILNGIADAYYDFGTNTSGSNISGSLSIVMTPNLDYILQNTAGSFAVTYQSGSVPLTGSFIFTVDTSTTASASNYVFNTTGSQTFEIFNINSDPDNSLNILASGSSGSRILSFNLKGVF